MDQEKKYTAFLSFAQPDRPLVSALHALFKKVGEDTYFAPKNLPQIGTSKWRRAIIDGIKASHCFVPIYTRHSLNRRWVLYESGVADSIELERFPARVSGVSYRELYDLPSPDALVYDLSDRRSLTDLVINVCRQRTGDSWKSTKKKVGPSVLEDRNAHKIISLARARWVFIAGNVPRDGFWGSTTAADYGSTKKYEMRLRTFLESLVTRLLGAGFNIASCPEVKAVGGVVGEKAAMWLLKNSPSELGRFQFGGIYPVDRSTRESNLPPEGRKQMLKYLREFRKSYLRNQEWVVAIGGSEGTMDEYHAAKEIGSVKVFAIPCFGGAAQRICERRDEGYKGPCCKCRKKEADCDPSKIVEYLRKGVS